MRKHFSFIAGFIVLFIIYHLPEFFPSLLMMAVCKIGILPVAYVMARMQGWKGLGGYGLQLHKGWLFNMLAGIVIGLLFFGLSEMLSISFGWEKLVSIESAARILRQMPLLLVMTFFPSIAEDILTRGYLYGHLQQRMRGKWWIILSAFVFVANHIWRYGDGMHLLTYLFILGIALAWALWFTHSLWLAFGMHWGLNIAYQSTQEFFKTETTTEGSQATWLYALCLLLMLVLIWAFRRSWQTTVFPVKQ